ncbi:PREDICTED: fasciculation and elongation protein zeta-1 [Charadrius vociferus]|uniref:fasciculation and elongation protein zeta-1 n=1 Tax=Charadrius vociferus TaxID=50402 RepID=UPI0005217C70|nr:PREDICTED: fasciculation and elongation protein zeta-1 [Charadrius vociferus]
MEAPLVSLEEEFEEGPGDDGGTPLRTADPALAELESFSAEMMSFKSMEDLVQEFDEKLTVCFRNYDAATEGLAPVRGHLQAQEEEERLQDEEVWDALTDGFAPRGSPRPWLLPGPPSLAPQTLPCPRMTLPATLDGCQSPPRLSDHQGTADYPKMLCEKEEEEEELTERSEQDSGINEEPLLTAEQVIEELEELMQSSPDPEADPEGDEDEEEEEEETEADAEGDGSGGGTEPILLQELRAFSPAFNNNCSHEGMATKTQRFSMEGISSILHSGLRQTFGPAANEKQYLNTVIPYEKKGSPPSVEDLQMLTNILFAMKEGNEKVPTLLTDYILKEIHVTDAVAHGENPLSPHSIRASSGENSFP